MKKGRFNREFRKYKNVVIAKLDSKQMISIKVDITQCVSRKE